MYQFQSVYFWNSILKWTSIFVFDIIVTYVIMVLVFSSAIGTNVRACYTKAVYTGYVSTVEMHSDKQTN